MAVIRHATRTKRMAAGIALLVSVTGSGTALGLAPAQSAPDQQCPEAFPVADLVQDSPVTGLTVIRGTEPIAFDGTYVDTLTDGIAPGLDMILVELTTPAITDIGIWAGMSGSPVYAANGELIGAVSYGLSLGDSPVAGVTPAADMRALLTTPGGASAIAAAEHVDVGPSQATRIARTTGATEHEAASGFDRLRMPLGVSGFSSKNRLDRAAKAFGFDNAQVYRAGSASTAAGDPTGIQAGGNLAASISYGDVTAAGVGTATQVCGTEVLAFGHPAFFTGPSQMTMHGAKALYVARDPFVPFKVANVTGPVGGITEDRMAGLRGDLGTPPRATLITSRVTTDEGREHTGSTRISVPDAVPDISATHLLVDQDAAFDGVGKGSARVGWTVKGVRPDGSRFAFSRVDHFADRSDITFLPPFFLYDQLSRVHRNRFFNARITEITTESRLSHAVREWQVRGVRVLSRGRWVPAGRGNPILTRPGRTIRLKVALGSYRDEHGSRVARVGLFVPKGTARSRGFVSVSGGGNGFFGAAPSGSAPQSFRGLLRQIENAPHNDAVLANLHLQTRRGVVRRADERRTGAMVTGARNIPVVVARPRR